MERWEVRMLEKKASVVKPTYEMLNEVKQDKILD